MRLLINIIFILFITRSPWTSVLLCWPPKVLQKCLFWQVLYIMAVDAILRIKADNLRIFPTKLLFCIFANFIFGLFPDVVQKIFNSQWLRSLMVLRRLVLLAVVLHLFLERSQLLSFDFIEHLVRHESFVSHHFSGQLFLLLPLMEAKNMLCLMTRALTFWRAIFYTFFGSDR